jgi:hemophore-related protein
MAADYANASGRVALATSGYLATHPDANLFFSSLRDEHSPQQKTRVADYMNAHPEVRDELTAIRQPLTDLENRCGFNDNDPSALYQYPG